MFIDRKDAGEKLARGLEEYKDKQALVLAIPKGGIEVGYQVAEYLNGGFSILIARKLPFPDNPESGFGAIVEDGSAFILEQAEIWLSKEKIDKIKKIQKEEVKRRINILRKGEPLPEITGKTVILVDDGIAMGSTMRAGIMLCRNKNAGKIIVAAPVSGTRVASEIGEIVDEVVILEKPPFFQAVAQVYENWYDVSDREAIEILERWQNKTR